MLRSAQRGESSVGAARPRAWQRGLGAGIVSGPSSAPGNVVLSAAASSSNPVNVTVGQGVDVYVDGDVAPLAWLVASHSGPATIQDLGSASGVHHFLVTPTGPGTVNVTLQLPSSPPIAVNFSVDVAAASSRPNAGGIFQPPGGATHVFKSAPGTVTSAPPATSSSGGGTTTTTTTTTSTPAAKSYVVPILVGAGVLAAGGLAWAAFARKR